MSCLAVIFGFVKMPMKFKVTATNIYIWQPYFFFHIYDHLNILSLAGMFLFSLMPITLEIVHTCALYTVLMPIKVKLVTKILHLTVTILLSHLSSFMPITLETVHMCIFIQC